MGSILYLTEIPPVGGDTLFASMYAAYEKLSDPIKRLVEGLTAVHDGEHVYRGRYGVDDRGKVFPKAEHPLVRTHPVTGKKALYVNRGFTTRIRALSRLESDALLEMLYRTPRRRNFSAASAGRRTRSHSGTTAASSITRCGTITRSAATATASRSKATSRSTAPSATTDSPSPGVRERVPEARSAEAGEGCARYDALHLPSLTRRAPPSP